MKFNVIEDLSTKEKILKEETLEQAVSNENKVAVGDKNDEIKSILSKAMKRNITQQIRNRDDFVNILLTGPAGIGKTARVKQWADENNINLVHVLASTMDNTDLAGAISPDNEGEIVKRLASTEFDDLDMDPSDPNFKWSVLFLDEYNRAFKDVRGTLLTLIQDHTIPDFRKNVRVQGRRRKLRSFLFTVAAINPPDINYNTDKLDKAENSRFIELKVPYNNQVLLKHQLKLLNDDVKQASGDPEELAMASGRIGIVTALLSSKDFHFDTDKEIADSDLKGNGKILTPRTLTNLLIWSDGTKDDFLKSWDMSCNNLKKPMAERILQNYQDIVDKANSVFQKQAQENPEAIVFPTADSLFDKLDKIGSFK